LVVIQYTLLRQAAKLDSQPEQKVGVIPDWALSPSRQQANLTLSEASEEGRSVSHGEGALRVSVLN
jgi:hypothetical protein